VEIGGTVGDIESIPFLEAARQFIHDMGREKVLFVHVTLVPVVYMGEPKTKPTQHSVKDLQQLGIQPDILICRAHQPLDEDMRRKISLFTNVEKEAVISSYNVKTTIYEVPLTFADQKLDEIIIRRLRLIGGGPARDGLRPFVERFRAARGRVKVAVVGKYMSLHDSYISIFEALLHGAVANDSRVELMKIEAEEIDGEGKAAAAMHGADGLLVPGGFGLRGIEGMIRAVRHARESGIPCLGICLGLQIMVIEYARTVLGLEGANSTEFDPSTGHPVVSLLEEQVDVRAFGGTMRLGIGETRLAAGTRIHEAYGTDAIYERHRHRYEISNAYRKALSDAGLIIGGVTQDGSLVESVEWPDHPWGVGVQFHPEFLSKPGKPGPLFSSFLAACLAGKPAESR
jgi:CTP synthase